MRIYYSSKFEREYKRLPVKIKFPAEKKEKIFRQNPFDQRLKTHKLTGNLREFWSFSIDNSHRIIFEFADGKAIWFHSVGGHEIYNRFARTSHFSAGGEGKATSDVAKQGFKLPRKLIVKRDVKRPSHV